MQKHCNNTHINHWQTHTNGNGSRHNNRAGPNGLSVINKSPFLLHPSDYTVPLELSFFGNNFHSASIKPRVSMTVDSAELKNLYEGDVSKKITKVSLPHGAARGSILARRRSTHSENHLASKRRTVVTDNALISFQRIMVNSKEFMEKAIESMPLRKYDQWFKPEGINPLLLTFTKESWELPLLRQPDPLYKYYILCAIFIFVVIFLTQELLMPVNSWGWAAGVAGVLILSVVGPLCWVATVHQKIVDPHNDREFDSRSRSTLTEFFYSASKSVIASIGLRALLFFLVCVALYSCAVVNVIECTVILEDYASTYLNTTGSPFGANASTVLPTPAPGDIPALCCDPWYFTYSVTLTLLVVWTFFRMHFLLKFSVYVAAVALYGFFVLYFAKPSHPTPLPNPSGKLSFLLFLPSAIGLLARSLAISV
ncbi:putative adenylate cyclase type 2 isoform X2 [Penaeus vannamei]|uniref:Putative adenylate cyclase type 2 isoform X2 n=1 Tax=Penaeus vannamei TaxID=6689 RepID=A0A423TRW8_PENVA|nr:putative adenylate cyclase type 2 isoform X2 [Penaeus vannamei]